MSFSKRNSAVSLFSGAGGMDVGFVAAGFGIVFANDIDPVACETYALNHGRIECGPIGEFLPDLIQFKDVDLVFGGPPCQGFSVAGKMDPQDPRSKLVWRFVDAVKITRPKAFVFENVKALGALKKWAGMRDALLAAFRSSGYRSTMLVLNALRCGVPQARERVFVIGIRDDFIDLGGLDTRSAIQGALDDLVQQPQSVSDVVLGLGRAGTSSNPRACNAVVTYAKSPVLRPSPYAGMMFNGAGRPLCPSGFSCTLPASMGGNKTPIVDEEEIFDGAKSFVEQYHSHLRRGGAPREGKAPPRLRRLTIDEALAIQSFPDRYKLAGRQSAMYRQIGNAVPCRMAEAVAKVTNRILGEGRAYLEDSERLRNRNRHQQPVLF